MSEIRILQTGILDTDAEAVVNAANEGLWAGGGVCGVIFSAAGSRELTTACREIGHCDTGSAVITPGFNLKAKYIVHAVGPVWEGGDHREPQLLYGCYRRSLELARENDIHSICFPLISAGIFGYPADKAWRKALQACNDFMDNNPDCDIEILFAVPEDAKYELGKEILKQI
ncbi:MAG: macro domain-containing protein [Oscillospiraceae bacterium]|nr:macro domain-containing protein [Oscillospiraceae bacterium]